MVALDPAFEAHAGPVRDIYARWLKATTASEQKALRKEDFRFITGKGNADKAAVIDAVRLRGFAPVDDNEADAIAILLWAIETRGGVR